MSNAEIRAELKRLKAALRERKRQFRRDAMMRRRRHIGGINRYAIQHR